MCGRGQRKRPSASQVLAAADNSSEEDESSNPKLRRLMDSLPSQPRFHKGNSNGQYHQASSKEFRPNTHVQKIEHLPHPAIPTSEHLPHPAIPTSEHLPYPAPLTIKHLPHRTPPTSNTSHIEHLSQSSTSHVMESEDEEEDISNIKRYLDQPRQSAPASSNGKFNSSISYQSQGRVNTTVPSEPNSGVLEIILKEIKYLRHEMREMRTSIDVLTQKMIVDTDKAASKGPLTKVTYPIESPDLLALLEEECKDENLRSCLVNKLRSFGGSNYGDHARRVLRYLFTDALIMSYTWQGSKDKNIFSKLQVTSVIIDAVCEEDKNVSRALVENSIKIWLRHAKERIGYKNK